ncbi:glycosyltransferase [Desulfosporosinus sp. BICA1-9]|uniref:glycosyltransferase n=1 Tax=Desulfosporosinus sp. BICA1-9 TaxID=1531958 RepID=UPI00054C29A5|nr:glycosyltransferase [Desulfosporosinus sp. BICA1-9]KJS46493.1 MAG: glycosyl transferase family 1 [Peptococcaceae bacterium BRH_c23]KJS78885.1 MAG: glycosyl transferase family 1 [Desulfosporosinus sp. BICA1-9]HBW38896.1 glycosyltransferase family 4 protein [Desulfosporosinus sp.]
MRVLMLSHMYPNSVSPLGGIFVRQQARALARLGVEVNVVAPVPWMPRFMAGRGKWGGYPWVPFKEQPDGFPVFHPRVIEFPRSLFFEYYPQTYAYGLQRVFTDQIRRGVDIIHAHVAHPDGAAALSFGLKYNIPVVVTIHGQDFAYTLNRSRTCAKSVRTTLKGAAAVILVSQKLRSQYALETWAGQLEKYRIIYNGVDLQDVVKPLELQGLDLQGSELQGTYSEQGLEQGLKTSRRRLLTVGFLRPDKGHAVVIKALPELIREFPDLEYRIVGDGSERAELIALTKELGLHSHVVFLGSLPHHEAMEEMAQCEVFILPSWNEAFGVVYLEAMAHGKPIIGTTGEGISEVLAQESVGKAVPPRDVLALTEAIREFLRNPSQAKVMGTRGKDLVSRQFTWEYNAQKTLKIYEEIMTR